VVIGRIDLRSAWAVRGTRTIRAVRARLRIVRDREALDRAVGERGCDLDHARARAFEFVDTDRAGRRSAVTTARRRDRHDFEFDRAHVERRVLQRDERQTRDAITRVRARPIVER
jgi:hypothetical protein